MSNLQTIGTALAVLAGFFVGSSTVLQKKGILVTKDLAEATGAKRAYMKSLYWWMGMLCLALGEVCNFVAYALTPAIIVAPLMAVSVVVSSIMAVIVLKEKLNFTASAGIILCLLGAVIIVLHGPMTQTVANLTEFTKFIIAPGNIQPTRIFGIHWSIMGN